MVIYVSRIMKGYEVRKVCSEFRDQESRSRRLQLKIVQKKKAAAGTHAT
jgi:hypothetical protein